MLKKRTNQDNEVEISYLPAVCSHFSITIFGAPENRNHEWDNKVFHRIRIAWNLVATEGIYIGSRPGRTY